jgi:hypothetical protein
VSVNNPETPAERRLRTGELRAEIKKLRALVTKLSGDVFDGELEYVQQDALLAERDATITRLEAERDKWQQSANATHKAASDNAERAGKAEARERALRAALTAAADALDEASRTCDIRLGVEGNAVFMRARDAARRAAEEGV